MRWNPTEGRCRQAAGGDGGPHPAAVSVIGPSIKCLNQHVTLPAGSGGQLHCGNSRSCPRFDRECPLAWTDQQPSLCTEIAKRSLFRPGASRELRWFHLPTPLSGAELSRSPSAVLRWLVGSLAPTRSTFCPAR